MKCVRLGVDEGMGTGDGHLLEGRLGIDRQDEEDAVLADGVPVRAALAVGLEQLAQHVLPRLVHLAHNH